MIRILNFDQSDSRRLQFTFSLEIMARQRHGTPTSWHANKEGRKKEKKKTKKKERKK
jgi:hypothetical protein